MNTIFVELSCNPVGYVAEVDIIPFGVARIHASSMESYVEAIAELRRGLAYLGNTGRMELSFLPTFFDDEEQMNAASALPAEELTITREYSRRIMREEANNNGLERLVEFMEAQAADEEENITVGEALRRAQEGKEQVRKIVEGEEPGAADPESGKEGERPTDPAW